MKDGVKVEVPKRTLTTLIFSNGVVNYDGVLKFGGRLEGDHVMHFKSWIKRPIAWNSI